MLFATSFAVKNNKFSIMAELLKSALLFLCKHNKFGFVGVFGFAQSISVFVGDRSPVPSNLAIFWYGKPVPYNL